MKSSLMNLVVTFHALIETAGLPATVAALTRRRAHCASSAVT